MEQKTEKKAKSVVDLRKLMQKMGMRTNAFAEACGVSTQAMAQYLRPGKSLTTATIYNIANALDIDPREMFFPTDEDAEAQHEPDTAVPAGEDLSGKAVAVPHPSQTIQTTAFCPHCGARVKVGVVLMAE